MPPGSVRVDFGLCIPKD